MDLLRGCTTILPFSSPDLVNSLDKWLVSHTSDYWNTPKAGHFGRKTTRGTIKPHAPRLCKPLPDGPFLSIKVTALDGHNLSQQY